MRPGIKFIRDRELLSPGRIHFGLAMSKIGFVPHEGWTQHNANREEDALFHSDQADEVIRAAFAGIVER